jgi:universal stress protein E
VASLETILVGTDFSPLGERAIAAAVALADRVEGARVHVAHIVPISARYIGAGAIAPVPLPETVIAPILRSEVDAGEKRLQALELPKARSRITREVRLGIPARELSVIADEIRASLVVVATHDRSRIARFFVGSVADALIRSSKVPVLTVGADRPGTSVFERVIAAVDLSPVTSRVIEEAAMIARISGGSLRILSAFEPPLLYPPMGDVLPAYLSPEDSKQMLEEHARALEIAAQSVDLSGIAHQVDAARGLPIEAITHAIDAFSADLVVMGTSGHNAWERMLLGSTANKVLAHATCPVLVVPRR